MRVEFWCIKRDSRCICFLQKLCCSTGEKSGSRLGVGRFVWCFLRNRGCRTGFLGLCLGGCCSLELLSIRSRLLSLGLTIRCLGSIRMWRYVIGIGLWSVLLRRLWFWCSTGKIGWSHDRHRLDPGELLMLRRSDWCFWSRFGSFHQHTLIRRVVVRVCIPVRAVKVHAIEEVATKLIFSVHRFVQDRVFDGRRRRHLVRSRLWLGLHTL